jgi:hypothetical protein
MIRKTIVLASILAVAPAAPAWAENIYSVRNETSRTFTCGLQRYPARKVYRFLLRAGQEHVQAMSGGNERTLLCDSRPVTERFRLRSGVRYALVVSGDGVVVLRPIAPAP